MCCAVAPQQSGQAVAWVESTFTDEALHAIAARPSSARPVPAVCAAATESIRRPSCNEVPSDATIIRVTVDEDTVEAAKHISNTALLCKML